MQIRKVGVVGLGTMGAGIAQVAAQSGFETVGREVSEELCERARGTIEHYLGRAVEKGRMTAEERDAALGRLTFTTARLNALPHDGSNLPCALCCLSYQLGYRVGLRNVDCVTAPNLSHR